jgi:hypothetical protein
MVCFGNIREDIKINRLKWLEHIRRMDKNSLCMKLTFFQLEGNTKKGRPKLRWMDNVLQDLKTLNVRQLGGRRHKTEIVGRML